MSSSAPPDPSGGGNELDLGLDLDLDLDRDLPTTAGDVATQRRLRSEQRLTPDALEAFLARLGPRPYAELRARKGPGGEPFEL